MAGVRVYRDSSVSVANDTLVAISFTDETFDDFGGWSVSTPTLLVSDRNARALVLAQLSFATSALGRRGVIIQRNGTTICQSIAVSGGTGNRYVLASTTLDIATGDELRCMAFQDSGAALNVNGEGDGNASWFALQFLQR